MRESSPTFWRSRLTALFCWRPQDLANKRLQKLTEEVIEAQREEALPKALALRKLLSAEISSAPQSDSTSLPDARRPRDPPAVGVNVQTVVEVVVSVPVPVV